MTIPLVSFVIPVLNSESDIARCLLSIRNQKCPGVHYEVLIMDNGSTDRTHYVMRSLGFDFQVVAGVNVSTLRNRGVAKARGDYIAFVDSDVELSLQWLETGLAAFRDKKVVAAGCFPGVPKGATWVQQTWDLHQRGLDCELQTTPVPWLSSMNLIVRRSDFLAIRGFNENLETAEDVDLCYRLGRHGTILCYPAMEAIHWGEARDLKTFWRKEVWRGRGNLHGIWSHGLRWDELPSLGYPLYMLCVVLLFSVGVWVDHRNKEFLLAPVALLFLVGPALVLALNTASEAKQGRAIPKLFLLYLIYGFARSYSLINAWIRLLA